MDFGERGWYIRKVEVVSVLFCCDFVFVFVVCRVWWVAGGIAMGLMGCGAQP
jgi:hypothetical protein